MDHADLIDALENVYNDGIRWQQFLLEDGGHDHVQNHDDLCLNNLLCELDEFWTDYEECLRLVDQLPQDSVDLLSKLAADTPWRVMTRRSLLSLGDIMGPTRLPFGRGCDKTPILHLARPFLIDLWRTRDSDFEALEKPLGELFQRLLDVRAFHAELQMKVLRAF